ncbi:MAG: polysaccharide deacetylase family protein, partial [Clostridia bacterium]|nr:polysaccharide deacetylase family protein [Clostridia bacterium]
ITATTCNGLTAVCEVTVIRTVPAADKYIALTFDDGPDANSGVILDAFAEHNAKCTFFVLYTNAQYNSSIVQRIANEGHELGNHTKTHNDLTTLPPAEAIEEIEFVNEFIYGLTGQTPVLYRPPYLSSSTAMLNLFPDMSAIGCSIDTRDWSGITKEEIVSSVVNNARDGAIVLMHCTMPNTRAAVPEILEQLEDMGYACVTVSELFEAKGVTRQGAKYYSNVWG